MTRATWWVVVVLAGCRSADLSMNSIEVSAEPRLTFAATPVGFSRTQRLSVMNRSRAPVELPVTVTGPFSSPETLHLAGGEVADISVTFAPDALGVSTGALHLTESLEVTLSGEGIAVPSCESSSSCLVGAFDTATLKCTFTARDDGTTCGSAAECVDNGSCHAGVCEGAASTCDDHNACTNDACIVGTGCVSIDSSAECVAPAALCLTAVCDPVTGCGVVDVVDGTPCGEVSCTSANVCLGGTCRAVTPPDGFECSPATVCSGPGVCRNQVCETPAARALTPRFTVTRGPSNVPDDELRFEGVTDAQGNWYWTECGEIQRSVGGINPEGDRRPGAPSEAPVRPLAAWCDAVSVTNSGTYRFRTQLERKQDVRTVPLELIPRGLQLLTSGVFVFAMPDGAVVAVDVNTGAERWRNEAATGFRSIEQLADDGRGRLWVLSEERGPDGFHRSTELTALASSTGTPRSSARSQFVPRGLVLDAAGNAYLSLTTGTHTVWQSFDRNVALRFEATFDGHPQLSVDDVVMGLDGQMMSTVDGSTRLPGGTPFRQSASVARSASSWFSVSAPWSPDSHVRHSSGGLLDLLDRRPSDLWLTANNDALFVSFSQHDATGPAPDVIQLTPSGRTVMRCTLDGADMGSVGFNGQTVAIADGETIRFYDVGMLGIGQRGWVAPRGRPEGTGLAR